MPAPHLADGSPDALREFVGECMAMSRIQAEIGERYAAIGDDVGLEYATRRLMAYVRASAQMLAELKGQRGQDRAEREGASE